MSVVPFSFAEAVLSEVSLFAVMLGSSQDHSSRIDVPAGVRPQGGNGAATPEVEPRHRAWAPGSSNLGTPTPHTPQLSFAFVCVVVRGHRLPHASTCHTTLVEETRCSQQRTSRVIKPLPVPLPRQTRLPALQRAAAARATPDAPLASPTLAGDSRADCMRDGEGPGVIQVSF